MKDSTQQLIAAYSKTKYIAKVDAETITLTIGQNSTQLDNILKYESVKTAAFITAWNPRSQNSNAEENAKANRKLETYIQSNKYNYFNGYGEGENPSWEPEKSFLVIGLDRQTAIQLGDEYQQNAIVFYEFEKHAELVTMSFFGCGE